MFALEELRTPEGEPYRCPMCARVVRIEPSWPSDDLICPFCGTLLWPTIRKRASIERAYRWKLHLGVLVVAAIGLLALAWVQFAMPFGGCVYGYGPAELVVLLMVGLLLFGRTLSTVCRKLGKWIAAYL